MGGPALGWRGFSETFNFSLRRDKLRTAMQRDGRYLLRAFAPDTMSAPEIWRQYIELTEIEESFKNLKGDLAIHPVFHQREDSIQAHIFVSFLFYCLHLALRAKPRPLATGLTPRAVLEKFATVQMIDVHLPAGGDKELAMPRYTQPDKDLTLLLTRTGIELPQQPPPTLREITDLHYTSSTIEPNPVGEPFKTNSQKYSLRDLKTHRIVKVGLVRRQHTSPFHEESGDEVEHDEPEVRDPDLGQYSSRLSQFRHRTRIDRGSHEHEDDRSDDDVQCRTGKSYNQFLVRAFRHAVHPSQSADQQFVP